MKKHLKSIAVLSISLTIIACVSTSPHPKQSFEEIELIKSYRPIHTGEAVRGRYNLYSYNVYENSVEIAALSPDIAVIQAEVFDTNKDGAFDSLWIIESGTWKFYSPLRNEIPNSTCKEVFCDYVGLANLARKKSLSVQTSDTASQQSLHRAPVSLREKSEDVGYEIP